MRARTQEPWGAVFSFRTPFYDGVQGSGLAEFQWRWWTWGFGVLCMYMKHTVHLRLNVQSSMAGLDLYIKFKIKIQDTSFGICFIMGVVVCMYGNVRVRNGDDNAPAKRGVWSGSDNAD